MTAKTYFTGRPCKRGHLAPRYTSTRTFIKCADVRAREYQALHKKKYLDQQNKARIKRLFGLSDMQYREILNTQNGGCAICGGQNSNGRRLAVDHDHSCCPTERSCGQCIRGLLCENCNHGLGKFKDDAEILASALSISENPRMIKHYYNENDPFAAHVLRERLAAEVLKALMETETIA